MNKMSLTRILELLRIERECVQRQSDYGVPGNSNKCKREWEGTCSGCDLVQSDTELLQMYDTLISMVSTRIQIADIAKNWYTHPGDKND